MKSSAKGQPNCTSVGVIKWHQSYFLALDKQQAAIRDLVTNNIATKRGTIIAFNSEQMVKPPHPTPHLPSSHTFIHVKKKMQFFVRTFTSC